MPKLQRGKRTPFPKLEERTYKKGKGKNQKNADASLGFCWKGLQALFLKGEKGRGNEGQYDQVILF